MFKKIGTFCCKYKQENKEDVDKEGRFLCNLIAEYSENTTIHGIPYFADSKRSWTERIWWAIGFVFSVTVCIYLISKTWIKWKENPVIVSFAQEHTPVWEIPFPAVTVCPLNKVNQRDFNYTAFYHFIILDQFPENFQESDIYDWETRIENGSRKFWNISLICNLSEDLEEEYFLDPFTTEDVTKIIRNVAPKLSETLKGVMWQNKKYQDIVSDKFLFHEQVTSEGLCFTFNALGHNDMYTDQVKQDVRFITHDIKSTGWSIEGGYTDSNYMNSYPERTSQAGLMFGLSSELTIAPYQRDGYCGDGVAGFKILLHNPGEIPRLTEQYFLAPAKQQVTVAVTPKLIKTSKSLVGIPPHTRNCFFAKEKKLRFFKIYTQYNCKTECEANITKEHCDCLPFYLPRDGDTKICGFGKRACLIEVKGIVHENFCWKSNEVFLPNLTWVFADQVFKYENLMKNKKVELSEKEKKELKIFRRCDCLASCDSLEYEVELSQAEYLYQISRNSINQSINASMLEITPMNIFFKESQFLALDRSELYGQTDFIANIGGLLGLFMGFSFLSFLEIVYFLTLRMWCKLYNKKKTSYAPKSIPTITWVK